MSPGAKKTAYAEQLEAYDRLVATNSKVERTGATVPTEMNGNPPFHSVSNRYGRPERLL